MNIAELAIELTSLEREAKALKDQAKALSDKASIMLTDAQSKREQIIQLMEDQGIEKLVENGVSVTMSNAPFSVVISNDAELPHPYRYEETIFKIDKKALINNRESLDIEGVEFVQTKKLTIKV